MINKKIGIIGCGNMGEAIFSRLAATMDKSTMLMASEMDAARRDYIQKKYGIIVQIDNNYLVKNSDVIILAVKPKDFDNVLHREVCCGVSKNKLLISIAAGIRIKYIEGIVGKDISVVRAMPNMPAVIGEAISVISRGKAAGDEDMKITREIFSAIGDVIEVDEKFMDSVTAVSGSGPAYFFYMIESLIEGAQALGLDKDTARRLVLKTALGSFKLLDSFKEDPGVLIKKVASKGGTTEAALKVFKSKKVNNIIKDALKKAAKRSKELSKG